MKTSFCHRSINKVSIFEDLGAKIKFSDIVMIKKLYYGDNLDILKNHINDEIIDLIYLDSPLNSQVNYNVIFNTLKGEKSEAQITAFEDTWTWNKEEFIIQKNKMVVLI